MGRHVTLGAVVPDEAVHSRNLVDLLLLEDSLPDAELVAARLEEHGLAVKIHRVDSRERFVAALDERSWDVVLSDYNAPSFDGMEALEIAREKRPDMPFIFVTGALGEERAIELLKQGATDYVLKDRLERLGPGVERALRETKEKTKLRRAQEALHASERTLTTLMGNMPGMAVRARTEPPFHFVYASPGARELTGYPPEAFQTELGWSSVVHPDDYAAFLASNAEMRTRGAQRTVRYRIRTRSGETKWVWDRAVGMTDESGKLVYFEGFITDITQQMEAELETQRRVELEQQLIGIVSHDLRNPLNVVMLAASTALTSEDLDPRVTRSLLKIRSAGDRAARMIRDLLDFTQARLGGGIAIERKSANLLDLVHQVVDEAETTHPGRRVKVAHVGGSEGEWDPDRLAQALQNLVVNALRHGTPETDVTVRTSGTDERIVVEVHNHGAPIPEELRARLFRPMQRGSGADRGHRSVGLGLYIVDSIVRGHGGQVDVTSTAEEGTTFRIELSRWTPLVSSRAITLR